MANEASLHFETHVPIPMTVADGTGILRGSLLTLSDPLTASLVTDSTTACAGIAKDEKIASDGKTKIPVYRRGIFRVTASGAIVVGEAVVFENSNTVAAQGATAVHKAGIALETAADGETFLFELNPSHGVIA